MEEYTLCGELPDESLAGAARYNLHPSQAANLGFPVSRIRDSVVNAPTGLVTAISGTIGLGWTTRVDRSNSDERKYIFSIPSGAAA